MRLRNHQLIRAESCLAGAIGLACCFLPGCSDSAPKRNAQSIANKQVQTAPGQMQTLAENDASAPSGTLPKTKAVVQRAIALLRAGNVVEANRLCREHLAEVTKEFGDNSSPCAWAHYEFALVYMMSGQKSDAIAALRKATEIDGDQDANARDRLTFIMNLGDILSRYEMFADAEKVHLEGLVGRESFYGRDHVGYAYGLESLATVLIKLGKFQEAADLMDETVAITRVANHPSLTTAIAISAQVRAKLKRTPTFLVTDSVPDHMWADVVDSVIFVVEYDDAQTGNILLRDLLPIVKNHLPTTARSLRRILISWAAVQKELGELGPLESTQRELLEIVEKTGDEVGVIETLQALAMTNADRKRFDESVKLYERAKQRAAKLGDAGIASEVHTNLGLYYSEEGKKELARKELTAALEQAKASQNPSQQGRVEIALGIFLQHQGEIDMARPMLSAAIDKLDPSNFDALCARSHHNAIVDGAECGCNSQTMGSAIVSAVQQYIRDRAPAGLIKSVDVKLDDGLELTFETSRKPTAAEAEELNGLSQHTLAHFQQAMRGGTRTTVYELARKRLGTQQ